MGKYLLPDGETLVTNLKCAVVSYPDDPRYRRALWGAISQLTKYWMWEPDGDGGEYDAADSWDEAYNQTLENFDMLDQILDAAEAIDANTDELEGLIRGLEFVANCCGEHDASNGDFYTEPVEDGTGDVPQNIVDAGFVSGVSDWTGFEDYKCMIAHVVLDDMVGKLRTADEVVDAAGAIIGGIAALTAIITSVFTAGLSVMAVKILIALGATAGLYKAITDGVNLSALADDINANRQALVCEFMNGDGPQDSYDRLIAEADIVFTDLQMLAVRNLNSGPVAKALYGGRYDQDDIAQRLLDAGYTNPAGFNCDCNADLTEFTDFGTNNDGLGNWTGGRVVGVDQINVRSGSPLEREGFTGWSTADRIKLTLQLSTSEDGNDAVVEFWYGGVMQESHTLDIGVIGQGQEEHVLTFVNPTGGDGSGDDTPAIFIGSTDSGADIFAWSALIEQFQA